MKLTKMNIEGQLDADGARQFAKRVGTSYIIAAAAAVIASVAALIHAIRWW